MKRKGMDAHVLGLALGVVVLLIVLAVIVGLNTSGAFRDFLNKVPWLNKIIPGGDGAPEPAPVGGVPGCTGSCLGLPSGKVLHFIAPTSLLFFKSGGKKIQLKISEGVPIGEVENYQIRNGDRLEYDVYLPLNTPCTGGITIETTEGNLDNDNDWKDQNGLVGTLKNCDKDPAKAAKDSVMSYAYRGWYHRSLAIPAGKTIKKISLVMSGETYDPPKGVVYIALYDNIAIKSSGGLHKFFENDDPAFMKMENCGFSCRYDEDKAKAFVGPVAYLPTDNTQPQNDIKDAPSGEILKLSAVGPGKWMYLKSFGLGAPYTVKPGDIVEYDVNINTCEKEVGGIDLRAKTGDSNKWKSLPYWEDIYDWEAGEWTKGTPDNTGMDLIKAACLKWHHRILPAPPDIWGKTVEIIDLVIGYDAPAKANVRVTSYYDNLRITDGTGTVKAFYPGGTDIALYQFDETEEGGGADDNYKTSTELSRTGQPV